MSTDPDPRGPIPVETRIERTRRFYRMENTDGPLLGFFLAPYYPLKRYRGASTLPEGVFTAEHLRVEAYLADYERLHAAYRALETDCIWTAAPFWGVPWVEAAAGCAALADHGTGSSRTRPPARNGGVRSPDETWLSKLGEFVRAIAAQAGGRYPLGTTLMRGVADVMAALHGSPEFVYALVDDPAGREREAQAIADLWIRVARAQLDPMPAYHGGVGSYFYNLWMPGRGVWIQEDAAALLSPELFERCLWPAIERIIAAFDSVIIHLHPTGFLPINRILESRLLAVEIHRDIAGAGVEELLPVYRRVQERKPLIIWGDLTEDELRLIRRHLDPASLAVLPVVTDAEQAGRILTIFGR